MAHLERRKNKDGSTSWVAQVRVNGYPSQTRSFPTRLEAELWSSQTEAKAQKRTLAIVSKMTLGDLIDEVRPRMTQLREAPLRYWQEELGHMPLIKIHPTLIAKHRDLLLGEMCGGYKHKKLKPRSGSTVWQYIQVLSRIFSIAKRELHIVDTNPVSDVERPKLPRGRTRFLTDDEIADLLVACRQSENEDLYAFVLTAVTTGARKGELLSLEWANVDVERRWAVFPKTKNGDARGVPLTAAALEALMQLKRAGPFVFPLDPTRAFHTACKRAKLSGVTLHTLRHSAASLLARNNATLLEVSRLLGHRDIRMADRYSHLANEHTTQLVDRIMRDVK